jgi:hypothetical protein
MRFANHLLILLLPFGLSIATILDPKFCDANEPSVFHTREREAYNNIMLEITYLIESAVVQEVGSGFCFVPTTANGLRDSVHRERWKRFSK